MRWLRLPYTIVVVNGESMAPALHDGDRLLVRRFGTPRPGQLVVFRMPPGRGRDGLEWMVKRVAAVPGDPVPPQAQERLSEPVVPPGRLVVSGDGANSRDSRHFGYVHHEWLMGVAVRRLGPPVI